MLRATTEPGTPASAGPRLAFLDALRGIAALAVVVQHGGERWWPAFDRFSRHWFDLGRFGVLVFFLVSGFIIPRSLEGEGSIGRFWVGRLFRLYPAYWVAIGLLVLVSTWYPATFSPQYQAHELGYTLVNLTMLQQFVGVPNASGVFYTLTIELLFYALCTALFAAGLLRRSYELAIGAVGVVLASCVVAPLVLDRRLPAAIPFYLASLFVGTALFRWANGEVPRRRLAILLGGIAIAGALTTWVSYDRFGVTEAGKQFSFAAAFLPWLAGYALLLGFLALRDRHFGAPLLGLGRISYSVYLLHPVVLAVIADWSNHALAFVTLVVSTLVLATLCYRFVEESGIRAGRAVRRRMRAAAR